ncbi:hypothetical protein TARUN_3246 [Trichoderma arundinaceum]|uniref:Uncharacterized protein n=1 Tax=Trichoderma arundinaceum TaxID=490622 RepID=A0A395NSS9_TRIAR|nr:hypothetical protein TARUN_3246 [Trichoderma arundinaceum]
MRVFSSLAILIAGTAVQHASAQVDYGTHDGSNDGSPSGSVNGHSGNTYGNPSGTPNGATAGLPGNLPGASSPDLPTCALQGITTVFVTVYPTGHLNPSGIPQSNDLDPNQTIHQTSDPAATVLISPMESVQAAHTTVKPFTTVTIDVWGSNPDSSDPFPSDVSSVLVSTDAASDPVETSASIPDGAPAQTQKPWPSNSFYPNSGSHATPSSDQVSITDGSVLGSLTTAAPVNTAYGDTGDLGSLSNSRGQQPSEYSSPIVTGGVEGYRPVQITVIGSDGKPTIIEFPSSQLGNGNSNGAVQPLPTAATPFPGFTTGPFPAASGTSAMAGETTCTTYTILGPNGVPTVVHSTWISLSTTTAALQSSFPSGLPSNPSVATDLPGAPAIPTYTTFTILGPDGLPTVVESSWLLPGPINTQSGISGPTPVSGGLNQATGTAAGVSAGGSTTCTSYTVLGLDGLPTIIGTTWVISSPTAGAVPANVVSGVSSQVGGVSGYPSQATTDLDMKAVTTCTSHTVLGPDGAPTIVESTFVVFASSALPTVTNGLPLPPAQVSNLPQGASNLPEGHNPATSCITVGVVGSDGFTTPVVQTILIPTSGFGNALPVQTTMGYPSLVPAQSGLPQGGVSVTPDNGAFTTCITVTTVGVDGTATPVVQTIVGMPIGTELGNPLSSLPTGVLSFPNSQFSSNSILELPNLTQYGTFGTGLPVILPPSAVVSGIVEATGTVTGTRTSTLTVTNGPDGQPATLVPYNDQWDNQAPVLGSKPLS